MSRSIAHIASVLALAVAAALFATTALADNGNGKDNGNSASAPGQVKQAGTFVHADFEAFVPLAGLIDPAAEAKRLEKQIGEKTKQLEGVKAKLANPNFTKAPADVVQVQKDLVVDLENQIRAMSEKRRASVKLRPPRM